MALVAVPAQARSLELQVFPAVDGQATMQQCPAKVTVSEQPQPYREGGYTIDGSAKLSGLATKFTIATSDAFSVTWVGKLKPQYSKCKATGRIVKDDGEEYQAHSHIRLRLINGNAYLILDMTGKSDVNNLTPAIVKKGVQNGNPTWSWSGTD